MAKRLDEGIEVRLRCHPRHGGEGRIGDIEPLFGPFENRGPLHAAHVVRMEVDRNANFAFERFDQFFGGVTMYRPEDGTNRGIEQRFWPRLIAKRSDKILIRDCRDVEGLNGPYFRFAIKSRAENSRLLDYLRRL